MIQRLRRWWYRFIGVPPPRDFTYLIDTDEYLLEKDVEDEQNP